MSRPHDEATSLLSHTIETAALTLVTGGKASGGKASGGEASKTYQLQKSLQDKAQTAALTRPITEKRHETAKAIVGNIR